MTNFRVDPEALILVQRNWTIYHTTWANVEAGLLDDEDLVLVQRMDQIYHMRVGDYRDGTTSLGELDFVWANLETQDRNEFAPSYKHFHFPWAQLRGLEFTLGEESQLTKPIYSSTQTMLNLWVENIRPSWDGDDPRLICPGGRVIPLRGSIGGRTRIQLNRNDPQYLAGEYMLVGQFDHIQFEGSYALTSVKFEEDIWNMMFWWNQGLQTDRRPHDPTDELGFKLFRNCVNLLDIKGAGAGKSIRLCRGERTFDVDLNFNGEVNGLVVATGPDSTTNNMFNSCKKFNNGGESMNSFKVKGIKNLESMFHNCLEFNADITTWDVSECEDMSGMFAECKVFNQDIGGWNVKNVTNTSEMIRECDSFDQDLGAWDVSNVTDMHGMFAYGGDGGFNNGGSDSIKNWDVGNVKNFGYMFARIPFNQPIGSWDTGGHLNADSFYEVFVDASNFNQDLTNWCVNRVTQVPDNFAKGTPIEGDLTKLPVWGTCP